MIDYKQSKIYKIHIRDEIYVGSTTKKYLSWRRSGHVADSKKEVQSERKLYALVNSLPNKWDGIKLELLEEYPCETKDQLRAKEAEWVRKIGTLNQQIPGRTCKEWCEEHKEETA